MSNTWTKYPYGQPGRGRWTITNGHMTFDVHKSIDGSCRRKQYPDGWIVRPHEADEYARQIVDALNKCEVEIK